MIHVGVDLHQRFCYITALDSIGRQLNAQAVADEAGAQQTWSLRSARKKEELDKPAKTLSEVIQLQNCRTHPSNWFLGERSRPRDRRSC